MKYPLHNMTDEQFELLVCQICEKILGTGTINFSKGKDGGKDAKFHGIADNFPSKNSPWNGKIKIQAKHTSNSTASCSDSEFQTLIKKEIPKIKKMIANGEATHYLLFSNRKLSGIQDTKLEDLIAEQIGIPNFVIGEEKIQSWISLYPEIAKALGLNKLLMPIQIYEKDLENVVLRFAEIKNDPQFRKNVPTKKAAPRIRRIPIEEKNRINNLTDSYFAAVFTESYSDFHKITEFLSDPKNDTYKQMYDNTIADIQEKIITNRKEFENFDYVFTFLFDSLVSHSDTTIMAQRKTVRVFLHYMYYCCHIGQKVAHVTG